MEAWSIHQYHKIDGNPSDKVLVNEKDSSEQGKNNQLRSSTHYLCVHSVFSHELKGFKEKTHLSSILVSAEVAFSGIHAQVYC